VENYLQVGDMVFNLGAYEDFLLDDSGGKKPLVGFFDPPITLKSGRPGHWYVNMRDALESIARKRALSKYVYEFCMDRGLKPDRFLGVPDGATPLGEELNNLIDYRSPTEMSASILRAGKKAHGDPANRYSVGPLKAGENIVLVEDVTTTGGSSMEALMKLQEVGVPVIAVVSCVNRFERRDRGRTVQDVLERDYGVKYDALTDARTILPRAAQKFKPTQALRDSIEEYYKRYGVEQVRLPPFEA
jgi:orotate phosphoribosyltransferase